MTAEFRRLVRRGFWSWLAVPLVPMPTVVAQAMPPASATVFVDVTVIPMDTERSMAHQTVLVRGDRIVALGPVAQVPVPADAHRVDGRGKFLIPGLADMHAHLDKSAPEAKLARCVADGVTTIRDMRSGRGAQSLALEMKRAIAAGTLLGPRIYTAGDINFTYTTRLGAAGVPVQVPDSASLATAADSIAALKRDGYDFVKLYAWPRPIYDSVIAAAHRVGLRVAGHVPAEGGDPVADANVERVLRDRWASIEHATGYFGYISGFPEHSPIETPLNPALDAALDTAAWMQPGHEWDTAKIRAIALATQRAGVWVVPNLVVMANVTSDSAGLVADYGPKQTHWLFRWADLMYRLTHALQEAGAGLLAGTDSPGSAAELPVLVERGGLTPYQALATATRNPADFLGTLDSTGTVSVGKRADLVLLNGNPLEQIRAVLAPDGVMVGGRWLSRAELDSLLAKADVP